jgi:hypothetical protein
MINSSGWGLASDGTRYGPNSCKITGRVFAEIINSSRDDSAINLHKPLIEKSSRTCTSNYHSEVGQDVCLGGEVEGPFIV